MLGSFSPADSCLLNLLEKQESPPQRPETSYQVSGDDVCPPRPLVDSLTVRALTSPSVTGCIYNPDPGPLCQPCASGKSLWRWLLTCCPETAKNRYLQNRTWAVEPSVMERCQQAWGEQAASLLSRLTAVSALLRLGDSEVECLPPCALLCPGSGSQGRLRAFRRETEKGCTDVPEREWRVPGTLELDLG